MSTKKSKWLVDPEELIAQVESHPILYDLTSERYSDKALKASYWKQVAESLSDDWNSLTKGHQQLRCRLVQAKWKHLRDNFRRECQRLNDPTQKHLKKRKYRFYDNLAFLIPHIRYGIRNNRNSGNYSKSSQDYEFKQEIQDDDDDHAEEEYLEIEDEEMNDDSMNESNIQTLTSSPDNTSKYESAEFDEDRAFCLSLVQSMKKVDEDHKLSARIEILNVIRKHTYPYCKELQDKSASLHFDSIRKIMRRGNAQWQSSGDSSYSGTTPQMKKSSKDPLDSLDAATVSTTLSPSRRSSE